MNTQAGSIHDSRAGSVYGAFQGIDSGPLLKNRPPLIHHHDEPVHHDELVSTSTAYSNTSMAKQTRLSSTEIWSGERKLVSHETANQLPRSVTNGLLEIMVEQLLAQDNTQVTCIVAWELEICIESDFDDVETLHSSMTVTGSALSAYATSYEEWIESRWGDPGLLVLNAILGSLTSGLPLHHCSHPTVGNISIEHTNDATGNVRVLIEPAHVQHAVKMVQTLAWMVATFRTPQEDGINLSSAVASTADHRMYISLAPLSRVRSKPPSSCWLPLLGNCIVAEGFHEASEVNGLELSLPLMLELTGMIYEAHPQQKTRSAGIFYTGVHSILYPTKLNHSLEIIMWHYTACSNVMTPPTDDDWVRICSEDLECKRMILGYTPSVQILLGTESRLRQYPLLKSSCADREKDSWTFAWDGVTINAGFSGSGLSFPLKLVRRKGQRAAPAAKPTYDQVVDGTSDQPVILFDTAHGLETAWLVSQLSVILDLVHLKAHRDDCWQNKENSFRMKLHAKPDWRGGFAAKEVLSDYSKANTQMRLSADDGNPIAIKHLVVQIFKAMSIRAQLDKLNPPVSTIHARPIVGWDLLQLMNAVEAPERLSFEADWAWSRSKAPSWLPLAYEIPVFFADNMGDVMTSTVPLCAQLQRSPKHLVASNQVLLKKLRACSKCDGYHVDTKKQLSWRLVNDKIFQQCCHGLHNEAEAKARFKDLIQLMVSRGDHKCETSTDLCRVIPQEGAIVFGAKRSLPTESRAALGLADPTRIQAAPM